MEECKRWGVVGGEGGIIPCMVGEQPQEQASESPEKKAELQLRSALAQASYEQPWALSFVKFILDVLKVSSPGRPVREQMSSLVRSPDQPIALRAIEQAMREGRVGQKTIPAHILVSLAAFCTELQSGKFAGGEEVKQWVSGLIAEQQAEEAPEGKPVAVVSGARPNSAKRALALVRQNRTMLIRAGIDMVRELVSATGYFKIASRDAGERAALESLGRVFETCLDPGARAAFRGSGSADTGTGEINLNKVHQVVSSYGLSKAEQLRGRIAWTHDKAQQIARSQGEDEQQTSA